MTDSLERFLQDIRFDIPPGLVERAKAAAATDAVGSNPCGRPACSRDCGYPRLRGAFPQLQTSGPRRATAITRHQSDPAQSKGGLHGVDAGSSVRCARSGKDGEPDDRLGRWRFAHYRWWSSLAQLG